MTIRGAKSLVARLARLRRVLPAKSNRGVMLAVVAAVVAAILVFLVDRAGKASRWAPARERLKWWYVSSRGRISDAWPQLHDLPSETPVAV